MDFSRTTHHHSNHHTDPSSSHAQFNIDWNLFHNALIRKKLPQKTHRWYTLRAERFLSYLAKCSISEISDVHVRKYLHAAVSDQRLKDWQARQVVDAIRILCMEVLGGEGFAIDGDSHRFSIDGDCHLLTGSDIGLETDTPARTLRPNSKPAAAMTLSCHEVSLCIGLGGDR